MRKTYLLLLTLPLSVWAGEKPATSLDAAPTGVAIAGQLNFNTDRAGGDYRSFDLVGPHWQTCSLRCLQDNRCKAWTYVKPGVQGRRARCWLKNRVPRGTPNSCCVSGTKR